MIAVILCGGVGSRLWPVSRENYPKQFLKLPDGVSFVQKSFLLAAGMERVSEVVVVTNKEFYFLVEAELGKVNDKKLKITYILEPCVRSTAAAIAAAAVTVGTDRTMIVLASDHIITNKESFYSAVSGGLKFTDKGNIVVFGIVPFSPKTEYGYIRAEGSKAVSFIEKPSLDKAKEYIKAKNYYWNSGMFLFTARTIISELTLHAPDTIEGVNRAVKQAVPGRRKEDKVVSFEEGKFEELPTISIDYAVMEKTDKLRVIPCDIGWQDVGSWESYSGLFDADKHGNRVVGTVFAKDVENCHIQGAEGRLVAALGLKDLFVVDTPDALLVADKTRHQDVKNLYNELKTKNRSEHSEHRTNYRPWGHYTLLQIGDKYKIKHLVILPGESLSLQRHFHRAEHWVVVKGTAKVRNDDNEILVATNESVFINAGHKHKVDNPGHLPLEIIEVQVGDYLGEDDLERLEDKYGRA